MAEKSALFRAYCEVIASSCEASPCSRTVLGIS